ncbi:diguanylate cyclase [Niveibacterium sp. SC-1]|uniref:diguanylate cyclase domain-containing protein n=1 Tax=Niveibacterium sp. SC-1 TaxID=3135646 RepID=UPI00311E4DA2
MHLHPENGQSSILRAFWLVLIALSLFGFAAQANAEAPADTVRLHFHRDNNDYTGWGLHIWGTNLALKRDVTWEHPLEPAGVDPYGVYFDVPIKPETRSFGFILHRGENKSTAQDLEIDIGKHGREVWLLENSTTVFTAPPPTSQDFQVGLEAARTEQASMRLRWLGVAGGALLLIVAWAVSQRRLVSTRQQLATQVSLLMQTQQALSEQGDRIQPGADDELTGLPTRGGMQKALDLALARARRQQSKVAVMFVDLDGFKAVNDTAGHDAGDAVLRTLAQRFRTCLRESDTVARVGGDEFIVVLENLRDPLDALTIARNLLEAARTPVDSASGPCQVGASIGITVYPGDGEDGPALLKKADSAMYQAKRAGKNDCFFADPALQALAEARIRLERELRQALQNGSLRFDFAPVLALPDGSMLGAELLPRWNGEPGGSAVPIGEDERNDFASALNRAALSHALNQTLSEAQARRGRETQLRFAVRLNGDAGAALALAKELLAGHAGARMIRLELPISALEPRRQLADAIAVLRGYGVTIGVGRLGLQEIGLTQLVATPFDDLVLDIPALAAAPGSTAQSLAQCLVTLGRTRGFRVVASGVDTPALRDWAARVGCDSAQGEAMHAAVSADNLAKLPA